MPNDALITALEDLRDTYSQRQRATNSLLAALRGVTGSLGTAGRTLSEYAGQSPGLDRARLSRAQEAFDALRLKDDAIDPLLPDLRREVKALTGVLAALREALTELRGDVVDVARLGHAYNALQAVKVPDDAITALLPSIAEDLEQAQRALGETFGWALRDALADQGIAISGRPPRFEVGRFEIAADFGTRRAAISYGKNLVARRVPLSVDAVIRAYQHGARAIMGRNEDGGAAVNIVLIKYLTPGPLSAMAETRVVHGQRLALALEPGGDDLARHDGGVSRHKVPRHTALDVAQRAAQERQAVGAGGVRDPGQLVARPRARLAQGSRQLPLTRCVDVDGKESRGQDERQRRAVVLHGDGHHGRVERDLRQPVGREGIGHILVRARDGIQAVREEAQHGFLGGLIEHRFILSHAFSRQPSASS
jgi:hypothetical protein